MILTLSFQPGLDLALMLDPHPEFDGDLDPNTIITLTISSNYISDIYYIILRSRYVFDRVGASKVKCLERGGSRD